MNQRNWITQWIDTKRNTSFDSDLADSIMAAVNAHPRRPLISTVSIPAPVSRFRIFRSQPVLLAGGTVGGFLRVAVFLYVLLFIC